MQNAIYPNNDFTSTSFLICIVSFFPVFSYFSLFLYVSPSSCLLIPLSHCLSLFLSFFIYFLPPSFSVCFPNRFLPSSLFRCVFLSLLFSFFHSIPSSFNACYRNRCLPVLSKAASASSSSFLPLFRSLCYLFLSDIPTC